MKIIKVAEDSRRKLKDVLPPEFFLEFSDTPASRFLDVEVIAEKDPTIGERWPGVSKNVYIWWQLANGYAIGWNENPGKGWSFPVIKKPI